MMNWLNSKKPVKLLLVLAICFFSFKYFRTIYHFKFYSTYTIGKCTSIEHQNASTYADFIFFVEGRQYDGSTKLKEVNSIWVNKYFKVRYSSKNPEINEILLDEMITDPKAVEAAGFKLKSKIE
ncbi:hypothetical protein [Pseudozobellia thermophila]|uniref:Uncharacterized protein n=1 Tax=Pseudozobellia thermophila TaxID=192903 RepID=A0A1M6P4E1_9FLAO|nr:hypothetical protein [Pseudozobellia thermophila]SHK02845.1 hypothetical protein SAMN04488513_1189 [Pseudozobellia thermophila]